MAARAARRSATSRHSWRKPSGRSVASKDFHELDNLESAYGYYLDKNLWNDLANLFADDGSMELAQRGIYIGRERVRGLSCSTCSAPKVPQKDGSATTSNGSP